MKRNMLLSAALLFCALVYSQVPDFTGSWKLNNSKSRLHYEFTMAPGEIIIVQNGNGMTVEKHSEFQGEKFVFNDKFTLDGKECINRGWQDTEKKSTATWSDDKKTLSISTSIIMEDGGEIRIIELYSMKEKNMVIDFNSSSPFGDISETMVYDRQIIN